MDKTKAGWTIIDQDAGVLALTYEFTKGSTATTFVARMDNGELLVISPAVGLSDAAAAELEELGQVGALVANNGFHYLGQTEWRKRYPKARCFAHPESFKRIGKNSVEPLSFEPLSELQSLTGSNVNVREVPNTKCGETWCWAKVDGGYAWYTSDVLANMPKLPDAFFFKWLFKLSKSAPGLRTFNLGLKFIVKDKRRTLELLLDDMKDAEPTVLVPAHGDIFSSGDVAAAARAAVTAAL